MSGKKVSRFIVLVAVVLASLATTVNAKAWGNCGNYYTVQWGDTLSGIAQLCGTTVYGLQAANPGLGYWAYAGQTLVIPNSTYYPPAPQYYPSPGRVYVIQWGETLAIIASRMGVSVNDILAANPQIWNANYIYAGQVINLPAVPVYYTIQRGDTLFRIAVRYGTSVYNLQVLNPQIWNPSWIYAGEVIRVW